MTQVDSSPPASPMQDYPWFRPPPVERVPGLCGVVMSCYDCAEFNLDAIGVIRRMVFEFVPTRIDRRVVEDRIFPIRAIASGMRLGYLDENYQLYRIHDQNFSAPGNCRPPSSQRPLRDQLTAAYLELETEISLKPGEQRAARSYAAEAAFWTTGYAVFWSAGCRQEGLEYRRRGLRIRPWSLAMGKIYLLCSARPMGSLT